ncbi:uncharacterized protein LOC141513049 isoform X2 [Macrotis lagotis]|uniref:uncharacterized protein LOC141513049 isoform X2 n=1 Tax=Macrotis lagotis TaxID=92651 RepID=UPI003D694569
MALLLLVLVTAGSPGVSRATEEKGIKDSQGWYICCQLLNTSKYVLCNLEENDYHGCHNISEKKTLITGKNCTHNVKIQDFHALNVSQNDIPACGGVNSSTVISKESGGTSFIIVIATLASSAGLLLLILISVGILSTLQKKWRNKRIFKKQKRWYNFLFKSKAVENQPDAIYSNVINLVAHQEDDFAIYVNLPCFQWPRKTSPAVTYDPEQWKHASTEFL